MRLSISPAKMAVARIVTHKSLERQVILALEEFGLFEFIDVRQQAGVAEIPKTAEEEAVYSLHSRLTNIINSLGLDTTRRIGWIQSVDDSTLTNVLDIANEVLKAIEAEVFDIGKEFATASLELERQTNIRDVALSLEPLRLRLDMIGASEFTYTVAGVLPTGNLSKLEWSIKEVTDDAYALRSIPQKRKSVVVSVTVPVELKSAVDRIFTAVGLELFTVPEGSEGKPEKIVADASEAILKLEETIDKLKKRRDLLAKEWGPRILAAWELMEIELKRINAKNYFVFTEHALKVWGWIPESAKGRFERILRERIGEPLEVTFQHPDFAEYDSPTYLENPSFMKPTEEVVKAYGIPSHHDLDPTKIMWLSFPLIFGLVFADVGQGFLILLIGLIAWRADKKGQDWGAIMGYLQTGAKGLMMMGIFAMLGGFLFGSFFGAESVIEPLWPVFAHTLENGEPNQWRSAHMLKLSIEVGVIQITLGIVLNLYNKLKHKDYREALVAFSYVWLYLGFIILVFGVSYTSLNAWIDPTGPVYLWIPFVGIGYGTGNNGVYPQLPVSAQMFTIFCLFVPLILMAISSFKGGMDGAVEFMEYGIGMISHTVSYARIFALNTVHVILSGIFVQFLPALIKIPIPPIELFGVEIVPEHVWMHGHEVTPYLPLLGAIVGTFIVGILEGLLAFMHTLRLHFVEWFSKFYHAGGVAFAPHQVKRLFTTVVEQKPLVEVAVAHN